MHKLQTCAVLTLPHSPLSSASSARAPDSAPETFKGETHTPASDIYSFAVLLYEVWTSKVPFAGEGAQRVAYQVSQEGRRPGVDDLRQSDCPPALVSIITELWAQEPSERPELPRLLKVLDEVGIAAGWLRQPGPTPQSPPQDEQQEYDEWTTVEYDDFRDTDDKTAQLLATPSGYDQLLASQLEMQRNGNTQQVC